MNSFSTRWLAIACLLLAINIFSGGATLCGASDLKPKTKSEARRSLAPPLLETVHERVLPRDFNSDKTEQMMRSYLRKQVHAALDERLKELEVALASPEKFRAYQQKRRRFLSWSFGPMPNRNPLNAKVTGTIDCDGYVIEKVLYESQPGFHVTGNVYRPDGPGPFPAILHPCGHSENGKAYSSYQKANRLLARNGFIVLCFDPIGQGERKQLIGRDGKPLQRGSGEHQNLGVAPILLGRSLGSYMLWDAIRGIDYLISRPDVDPQRIGCTGNSGGGNLTSYLMAYDDRITAAAPGCFMTTHRRKNESPGPGDAEQNLRAQIGEGFDHPDFILTRAPKPTLILSATKDFVPIEGTWEAFRQAKRAYTMLGHPERIDLIEANEKHGFTRRLREGAVRFFARWLQERRVEVFEEDEVPVLSDAELRVTPEGQVLRMEGERSMHDLFTDYEKRIGGMGSKVTREVARKVAGVRPLDEIPEPRVEFVSVEGVPQRIIFHPEPGIVLPGLYWPGSGKLPILMAPESGMNSVVTGALAMHARGHPVLVVDVRDMGETKTHNWRFYGADYYIAYMLGKSWLGMRTEDLLVCARWLAGQNEGMAVHLIAYGETAPPALHAATLEPSVIGARTVQVGLKSWHELMTMPDAHKHIHNAVPEALKFYDLPDLKRLALPHGGKKSR